MSLLIVWGQIDGLFIYWFMVCSVAALPQQSLKVECQTFHWHSVVLLISAGFMGVLVQ